MAVAEGNLQTEPGLQASWQLLFNCVGRRASHVRAGVPGACDGKAVAPRLPWECGGGHGGRRWSADIERRRGAGLSRLSQGGGPHAHAVARVSDLLRYA